MKKCILTFCIVLVTSAVSMTASADDELFDKASHLSTGFLIGDVDGDLSLGVQATSPYILANRLAFRLSGNLLFFSGIPEGETTFSEMPYFTGRFGVVGVAGTLFKAIRIYAEGGVVVLVPNSDFSDTTELGGYGAFGFELFMSSQKATPVSYFLELGTQGMSARAEKIAGEPNYGYGMLINAGFRLHL